MRNPSRLVGGATSLDVATPAPDEMVARAAGKHQRRVPGDRRSAESFFPVDLAPASGLILAVSISLGFWLMVVVMILRGL